jgi:hypothetical protein
MIRAVASLIAAVMFALTVLPVPWAAATSEQYVRTQSGKVRCGVHSDRVACQYLPGFPQAPVDNWGSHPDIANVTSGGAFSWMEANLATQGTAALQNDVILNYGQSYDMQGWTMLPSSDGTRFTNDATDHGMFVSVDNVSSF